MSEPNVHDGQEWQRFHDALESLLGTALKI